MKVLVIGANGKMGKQVVELCKKQNIEFIGVDPIAQNYKKQFDDDCKSCDIAIDFSMANALEKNLEFCIKNKINIVVATTGHNATNLQLIQNAKKHIAIFFASNFSVGFYRFLSAICYLDNKCYDVAIVEQHHKHKKDNPSGSAKSIQKILSKNHSDIQTLGIRCGEEVGTHTVMFFCANEKITISHQAYSRQIFASGAMDAARFLQKKRKGIFEMKDLICDEN